jgi:RNA polymerase sigma-70 factor (sigma-E family)
MQPFEVPARQDGVEGTRAPLPDSTATGRTDWPPGLLTLFSAHRTEMVRLAHVVTGSNTAAEDVVQDVFLRLRRRWPDVENPAGYLRRSVVNSARDHVRHEGVVRRHAEAGEDAPTGPTGDPEIDETWAAVRRLPPRQRAVLALRFYEDLPEAEIAEILGCRIGTVKSNLHRGLTRLRKELS